MLPCPFGGDQLPPPQPLSQEGRGWHGKCHLIKVFSFFKFFQYFAGLSPKPFVDLQPKQQSKKTWRSSDRFRLY